MELNLLCKGTDTVSKFVNTFLYIDTSGNVFEDKISFVSVLIMQHRRAWRGENDGDGEGSERSTNMIYLVKINHEYRFLR